MNIDRANAKNLLREVFYLYGGETVGTFLDDVESCMEEVMEVDSECQLDEIICPRKENGR